MSIIQTLSNRLIHDPLGACLAAGVVSSSYFFCANIGAVHFGIVPAIRDADGVELPVATKVALWKWFFDKAKVRSKCIILLRLPIHFQYSSTSLRLGLHLPSPSPRQHISHLLPPSESYSFVEASCPFPLCHSHLLP